MVDWHHLFGAALMDLFRDSPWKVEVEREMSVVQQFLDVLLVRRLAGEFSRRLPDGLEDLVEHNLLTYKSMHEPLDEWALKELTHHFVAYRKLERDAQNRMFPESQFRLFGISTRFPEKLSGEVQMEPCSRACIACNAGRMTSVSLC